MVALTALHCGGLAGAVLNYVIHIVTTRFTVWSRAARATVP